MVAENDSRIIMEEEWKKFTKRIHLVGICAGQLFCEVIALFFVGSIGKGMVTNPHINGNLPISGN